MEAALREWIGQLVLRNSVIKHWAELRLHACHLRNVYKLFKIVAGRDVHFVLSAQYIQLFGDRYPAMRLQRDESLIGGTQVNLALNFERHHRRYFDAPPLHNSLLGTPLYTRFRGDRFFPRCFPRATVVRGIVGQMLVAAEREGMFFPMVFLLKAALRKAFVKTNVEFLLEIEQELLQEDTIAALVDRCHELKEDDAVSRARGAALLVAPAAAAAAAGSSDDDDDDAAAVSLRRQEGSPGD